MKDVEMKLIQVGSMFIFTTLVKLLLVAFVHWVRGVRLNQNAAPNKIRCLIYSVAFVDRNRPSC
jgi:hypothetical protein